MSSEQRKKALGKGLGALLGSSTVANTAPADPRAKDVRYVALDRISPNPRQPRRHFAKEALEELSASIAAMGVLQPVLVCKDKQKAGHYILLAGERRLRASELAGLTEIPAQITEVTDEEMLEIAIVENVQREDLNPVEEARAYKELVERFAWSQETIAKRIGKSRVTIANSLRLLKLGSDALQDLEQGRMTAGHARAILSIDDPFYRQRLRQEIVDRGISVREAEKLATRYQSFGPPTSKQPEGGKEAPAGAGGKLAKKEAGLDTVALEDRLMVHLGCRVRITSKDQRSGTVEIPFRNPEELQRFLEAIGLPE
jgi:ParB family chromosome partitioning protein